MSRVIEINRPEQLETYRVVWQALFGETPRATLFQTLDWLLAYWQAFGGQQQLKVLVVTARNTPIGILPLTVVQEPTRVGRVRTLTYPLSAWGSFYGPIGPHSTATLLAAMRHLTETPRDWDLLDLRWVDRDQADRGRTRRVMQWTGLKATERIWKSCAQIDMDGTWDDYLAARQGRFRNELRRSWKRVAARGEVTYVHHRPLSLMSGDGDPRWDLFDACRCVAERSWQGSSTTGNTLNHSEVREFFRSAHAVAAKQGMLDVHLMFLGDRPVAFTYNYHHQGYVFGLRTGYDPEFADAGLGKVVRARTIRTAFEQGDQTFDLGPDYLPSKRPWLTRIARSYRYTHYPLSAPRTQLLRLKHWLTQSAAISC